MIKINKLRLRNLDNYYHKKLYNWYTAKKQPPYQAIYNSAHY